MCFIYLRLIFFANANFLATDHCFLFGLLDIKSVIIALISVTDFSPSNGACFLRLTLPICLGLVVGLKK